MGVRYESKEALRQAVEKRLKRKIEDSQWKIYGPDWPAPYGEADFKEVLELIRGTEEIERETDEVSPAVVRSDLIPPSVMEWVHKCRKYLFNSEDAPFDNLDDMRRWIREEAAKQVPPKGHAPRFGYYRDFGEMSEAELQDFITYALAEDPGPHGVEFAALPYPGEGGFVWNVIVSDGNAPLRHLWLVVKRVSRLIDCEEYQATAFILANFTPSIPALSGRFTINSVDSNPQMKIELTIRGPVSVKDVENFYREMRTKYWGIQRDIKLLSNRDAELVRFVTNRFDPDDPQWASHMAEWNVAYPEWRYDYWRHFRIAYLRAYEKVYPRINFRSLAR